MSVSELIKKVKQAPESIEFSEVITCIEENYQYSPTSFSNGDANNEVGANEGSCKIFAFAQLNDLSKEETLALFGAFYREDVLQHPGNDDHANIRNFMQSAWSGIQFDGPALSAK